MDETVDSEEQDIREEQRRGRWSFGQDHDPVVSAIKSMKDLFPNVRVSMDPTTSLKLRKRIYPLKTVLTLGADYNTQIGVWQFRSTWEDSIIGGRISIAGREVMLTKSWLLKVMDSEDVATRLKFRAAINTRDWTAYAKFGFRTERISPLNIKDGFQLAKKFPLDGHNGKCSCPPCCWDGSFYLEKNPIFNLRRSSSVLPTFSTESFAQTLGPVSKLNISTARRVAAVPKRVLLETFHRQLSENRRLVLSPSVWQNIEYLNFEIGRGKKEKKGDVHRRTQHPRGWMR